MKGESRVEVELERNSNRDGGYGWIVCSGTFIVNFVVFGIHNSFGVVYVKLLDDLELGEMQAGKQKVILSFSLLSSCNLFFCANLRLRRYVGSSVCL